MTRIENLNRRMYSREGLDVGRIRQHDLPASHDFAKNDWEHSMSPKNKITPPKKVFKSFLIFSVAFFFVAVAYASYLYLGGNNLVSNRNIAISINGPVSIKGGDKLSLEIAVENNNSTALEVADIIVEYPDGARNPDDLSVEMPRFREGLGDIAPGEVVKKTVSVVLFGEERAIKKIKIVVEYRVSGSNAIFYKEFEYEVIISSAPLSILVEAEKEATSGQETVLKVRVSSNSNDVIKGIILKAEYPSGFSFKSSDPNPFVGNNLWNLGDMKSGSSRVFTIKGVLSGEDLDSRVFGFVTGTTNSKDNKSIATPFATIKEEVSIKKSFVGVSLEINSSNENNISVKSGKPLRVDIKYINNLLVPVSDVEISLKVDGAALDKSSVSAEKGFYRSVDNTIIWNKSTYQTLSSIPPGESGNVGLTLSPLSMSKGIASIRNPEIKFSVSVKGKRVEGERLPQEVVDSILRSIKIQSDVTLASRLLYYSGPFKNKGPIPPRTEKETTYNVILSLTNGSNDLSDGLVTVPLPPYVRFIKSEAGEVLNFEEGSGLVTWNIGSIKAGTGFNGSPKEAVFQIAFTPSVSQIGDSPILLNDISFSGYDRFTLNEISLIRKGLDTSLTSDSGAKQGDNIVVK